jgi:hypothetical protein
VVKSGLQWRHFCDLLVKETNCSASVNYRTKKQNGARPHVVKKCFKIAAFLHSCELLIKEQLQRSCELQRNKMALAARG